LELKDDIRINAPRAKVYAALNDPEVLRQSISGCEALEKTSDTTFEATVTSKVGPLTVKLKGHVELSDLNPPEGYTLSGEGKGGPAGFAKVKAKVSLADEGATTLLHYEVKADVGGKLGQLGGPIIDRTARKLAGEFFQQFETLVSEPGAVADPGTDTGVVSGPSAAVAPSGAGVPRQTYAVWYFIGAVALALAAWVMLT